MKAIVKKKMPIGAGTPTGKHENGLTIILAKTISDVNPCWRKFPEDLPPATGCYLVVWGAYQRDCAVLRYDADAKIWNTMVKVTHWMPLPPIPEGVDEP